MKTGRLACRVLVSVCIALISACASVDNNSTSRKLILHPERPVYESGSPTVVQLLLRADSGKLSILSVSKRRDSILKPLISENINNFVSGESDLFAYTTTDADGRRLDSGMFIYPRVAAVEYLDPQRPHVIRSGKSQSIPNQAVSVRIPYNDKLALIIFEKLVSSPSEVVQKWKKIPFGKYKISLNDKGGRDNGLSHSTVQVK